MPDAYGGFSISMRVPDCVMAYLSVNVCQMLMVAYLSVNVCQIVYGGLYICKRVPDCLWWLIYQ